MLFLLTGDAWDREVDGMYFVTGTKVEGAAVFNQIYDRVHLIARSQVVTLSR